MRLDKFLCDMEIGSRKDVKEFIKKGKIRVNGSTVSKPEFQINESEDEVTYNGEMLKYKPFVYYMMNKPAGVITANRDKTDKTVMDILPTKYKRKDLFAVGRLDKDTTGLLLLTNNGPLSHMLLSSKYHVWKTYLVTLKEKITTEQIKNLREGVDLGQEGFSLPAKCDIIDECGYRISLSIREGKFHQVKRMLSIVGNEVVGLHRLSFGSLTLPENLSIGEVRELSETEERELTDCVRTEEEDTQ